MSKLLKLFSIVAAFTLILVGCSSKTNSGASNSGNKTKIVTSVNFYAEVAKSIAGDKAEVSSIISSTSVDPHDFEPTAQDAKNVADANIAILNGGGYDSWFEKLTANSKDIKKIDGAKLLGLKDGENEHIWYNPEVMSKVADELTKVLSEKDSSNKDFYEKNRDNYKKELSKITDKINSLKEEAERSGQYYINHRWLGGTLTNYKTIKGRIDRIAEIEKMEADGVFEVLPKKEVIELRKEYDKLNKFLGGIREMKGMPDAIFVVDPKKEHNAIAEAKKLGIPVVGIVDTNCDPDDVDYVIPANDDAIRAVKLLTAKMADAFVAYNEGNIEGTEEAFVEEVEATEE